MQAGGVSGSVSRSRRESRGVVHPEGIKAKEPSSDGGTAREESRKSRLF